MYSDLGLVQSPSPLHHAAGPRVHDSTQLTWLASGGRVCLCDTVPKKKMAVSKVGGLGDQADSYLAIRSPESPARLFASDRLSKTRS